MNIGKLFNSVGTHLAITRAQVEGAPGVCTARWMQEDWDRWTANQKRVRAREYRLHCLYYKLGKRVEQAMRKETIKQGLRP